MSNSTYIQDRVEWAGNGPLAVPPLAPGAVAPALSLVVPTLNEREDIEAFLAEVRRVLDAALPARYELIVVDDESPDGTGALCAALLPQFPELRLVRRAQEKGLARAVIRGWQAARGEVLGTINADFQHPPSVLARMVERMDGADVVAATRRADGGGDGDWGLWRRFTSQAAALMGKLLLPQVFTRLSDPLSGCYFIRRAAIARVELQPTGYKTLMEVVARGRVHVIRECGYEMRRRERGQSKATSASAFQYARHIWRLRQAARRSRS